jgi:hypothetical protein
VSHAPPPTTRGTRRSTAHRPPCSLGLSATSQQYFSLRTNQPAATSQQYFSLRTNQHQPSTTSHLNRLMTSKGKSLNYKVIDLVESCSFHINFISIPVRKKKVAFFLNKLNPTTVSLVWHLSPMA